MTKIESNIIPTPYGDVTIFTLVNSVGASVELSTLGAGVISVVVPDVAGNLADVALGYNNIADYYADGPCAGKIPGRYANRIALGRFSIDGNEYQLRINNGPNALHGGPDGFQNRIWNSEIIPDGVRFSYYSADGEENYPGNLTAVAEYIWDDDCRLALRLHATTDKPTIINLTNHTYWNLRGEGTGKITDHLMKMRCSRFLPGSDSLIPTGEMQPVDNTPMDFRNPKSIGRDLYADFPAIKYAKGYDSSWVIDDWIPGKMMEQVVVIEDPESGRILEIGTTQPAAHVYTGNWLSGSPKGKCGRSYEDYEGVAVEMQGMPDAPNKQQFPSQVLRPGESYDHVITFKFRTR